MIASHLLFAAALLGQGRGPAIDDRSDPADRLTFMQKSAASYTFSKAGTSGETLQLQAEPAFRMGKQAADNVGEGAIFFWNGSNGRPEAVAQIFFIRDSGAPKGIWVHEFVSLAPDTFVADRNGRTRWSPQSPGVVFKAVPGAPAPADNKAQRSTQMRALAKKFKASDDFKEKGWINLRLLPTPVARYGKEGSPVIDGALFVFVTATDPETFLFIEDRVGPNGPEWQYAFAPMTCYALKGMHGSEAVWTAPLRLNQSDPAKPYVVLPDAP